MTRVLWRSILEPLRSTGSAVGLVGAMLLLWLLAAVYVLLTVEQAQFLPWIVGRITNVIKVAMLVPALVLTLPIISGEAKNRTLMLKLLQPVGRAEYYTGRVLGRAIFALAYFSIVIGGLYVEIQLFNRSAFAARGETAFPPDTNWTLIFTALSLVTVVMSLAALAPLSSSRFGHLAFWFGLYIMVQQGSEQEKLIEVGAVSRGLAWFAREVVHPFLLGPHPDLVAEASLGSWYIWRPLAQWGFGLALAYLLGVFAFSRMEVGQRV